MAVPARARRPSSVHMAKKNSILIPLSLLSVALLSLQCCGPKIDESQTGSIAGRVYFDENANEECEDCECGIAEVTISLYEEVCGGVLVQMIKTDAEGYFTFYQVSPGAYCVYSGLEPTCDGFLPTTSVSHVVELAQGEEVELEWFGYDLYIDSLRDESRVPTGEP